jgi:hypothetical protein
MTEIKQSIKIDAFVNKVFGYASNYLKWSEFFEGLSDVNSITKGGKYEHNLGISRYGSYGTYRVVHHAFINAGSAQE